MGGKVKLVVFVPIGHTENVLQAIGDAGGGEIGNYTYCSFVVRGCGRFLPGDRANPAIGQRGVLEAVEEDRIEVTVRRDRLELVLSAMENVHPYEEIAYDVYPLEDI